MYTSSRSHDLNACERNVKNMNSVKLDFLFNTKLQPCIFMLWHILDLFFCVCFRNYFWLKYVWIEFKICTLKYLEGTKRCNIGLKYHWLITQRVVILFMVEQPKLFSTNTTFSSFVFATTFQEAK